MFKHILIATDGSELSRKAVERGIALAQSLNARLTVVTSSAPFHVVAVEPMMVTDTKERYATDAEKGAKERLQPALEAARAAGVRCDPVHVFSNHPYQAIIDTALARECDLVTMASHGRKGVTAALLGSETQQVLAHCKLPVLVWR
jgi:nucleotide-binding universal stress UspA family protein